MKSLKIDTLPTRDKWTTSQKLAYAVLTGDDSAILPLVDSLMDEGKLNLGEDNKKFAMVCKLLELFVKLTPLVSPQPK